LTDNWEDDEMTRRTATKTLGVVALLLLSAGNARAQGKLEFTSAPAKTGNVGEITLSFKYTPGDGYKVKGMATNAQITYWQSGIGLIRTEYVAIEQDKDGNWLPSTNPVVFNKFIGGKEYNVIVMVEIDDGSTPGFISTAPATVTPTENMEELTIVRIRPDTSINAAVRLVFCAEGR
jgi:hypothetical protein